MSKIKEFVNSLELLKAIGSYNPKLTLSLLIISIVFILLAIIIWCLSKKISKKIPPYKKLSDKFVSLFTTFGVIGIFLAFFSWQEIPYFSSRILILLSILFFILWLLVILIYIQRRFSWELEKFKQDERFKKYLPRPKRQANPIKTRKRV